MTPDTPGPAFSDEMLRAVKGIAAVSVGFVRTGLTWGELELLLTRLDAAEDVVRAFQDDDPLILDKYAAWRKACGRE